MDSTGWNHENHRFWPNLIDFGPREVVIMIWHQKIHVSKVLKLKNRNFNTSASQNIKNYCQTPLEQKVMYKTVTIFFFGKNNYGFVKNPRAPFKDQHQMIIPDIHLDLFSGKRPHHINGGYTQSGPPVWIWKNDRSWSGSGPRDGSRKWMISEKHIGLVMSSDALVWSDRKLRVRVIDSYH